MAAGRRFDAVVFDLLTALIDSWTLWNRAAGSAEDGLRWRRKYLELTYAAGRYRPYEAIVREAAIASGVDAAAADRLIALWPELPLWSETPRILDRLASRVPLGVATNCSKVLGLRAVEGRVGTSPRSSPPKPPASTSRAPNPTRRCWGCSAPMRDGRCSWPGRPRTFLAPRRSACRFSGITACIFSRSKAPSRTTWRRRSSRSSISSSSGRVGQVSRVVKDARPGRTTRPRRGCRRSIRSAASLIGCMRRCAVPSSPAICGPGRN